MLWMLPLIAAARVAFVRTIAPPHDLGRVQDVAVITAIGDSSKITRFLDDFVEYAGRGGTIRVTDAVEDNRHLVGFDDASMRRLRREHPADAYVSVSLFTCAGADRTGEVGEADVDGKRVHSQVQWVDAICSARIDVRTPAGKRYLTFMVHGEGTSPRRKTLTADERDVAYEQAARYTALNAAQSIAPRRLRESIELDDKAPAYNEALPMITSDRLTDARSIWEQSLKRNRDSAPLHYNLGAICEAMGDLRAAQDYYKTAARLSSDRKYKTELDLFKRRNAIK